MKVTQGPMTYISSFLFGPDDPVLDQFTELYMAVFKTVPIQKLKPFMVISGIKKTKIFFLSRQSFYLISTLSIKTKFNVNLAILIKFNRTKNNYNI